MGIPRFRATSTVLITFGTIASPPLTSIGASGSIKSFWNLSSNTQFSTNDCYYYAESEQN